MTVPLRALDEREMLWREPRASTLVELLAMPGREYSELEAVVLCHHGEEPETIAWGELLHAASVQASALLGAGIRPRERVVIALPTSRDFLHAFFGTLLAGAIPVPAAPPATLRGRGFEAHLDLLRSIVRGSASAACLCTPGLGAVLRPVLDVEVLSPATSGPALEDARVFAARPDDVAFLQFSSGSTSAPKGIALTNANVIANLAAIAASTVERDTVCVSWLPLHHDMGLIGTMLTALYARVLSIHMPPQAFVRDPSRWLRAISDFRATMTVAPNFAFRYCAANVEAASLEGVRLDSLRSILNGAEPIDAEAVGAFQTAFAPLGLRPDVVRPVYGLAENTLAVTFADPGPLATENIDAEDEETAGEAAPARPGRRSRRVLSVGRPVPGVEIAIAGEDDRLLPERRTGQVLVRGRSVMSGYFGDQEATAAALANGWLHTGDLGYIAGGQLFLTGRSKDIIIRHGRNYHPVDLEHQLEKVSGAGAVVAFAVEADGEAAVVIAAETRLVAADDLAALETRLRAAMHDAFTFGPAEVVLLHPGRIPRTTSGKVRRSECRRLYSTGELIHRRSSWTPSNKT